MTKDIVLLENRISELEEMLSATTVALGLNGNYQELVNQAKEVLQRCHLTSRSSRAAKCGASEQIRGYIKVIKKASKEMRKPPSA